MSYDVSVSPSQQAEATVAPTSDATAIRAELAAKVFKIEATEGSQVAEGAQHVVVNAGA